MARRSSVGMWSSSRSPGVLGRTWMTRMLCRKRIALKLLATSYWPLVNYLVFKREEADVFHGLTNTRDMKRNPPPWRLSTTANRPFGTETHGDTAPVSSILVALAVNILAIDDYSIKKRIFVANHACMGIPRLCKPQAKWIPLSQQGMG